MKEGEGDRREENRYGGNHYLTEQTEEDAAKEELLQQRHGHRSCRDTWQGMQESGFPVGGESAGTEPQKGGDHEHHAKQACRHADPKITERPGIRHEGEGAERTNP